MGRAPPEETTNSGTPIVNDDGDVVSLLLDDAARCEAAQLPIQGGMPDERATVTRERYRNANVIAGYIRLCVKYFTHGWPHVGVRQLLTGNRSNKGSQ
jgi:hypothetical protein